MNIMSIRGQALIESVPFFLILFGLMATLIAFTQWFLIHQKLLIAAREGAMLYSSGRFNKEETRVQIQSYLEKGTFALEDQRIQIDVGPWQGPQAKLFQLDEVRVRYVPSSWLRDFFKQTLEEKCVIKHAPHYGPPFQTLYGPPELW